MSRYDILSLIEQGGGIALVPNFLPEFVAEGALRILEDMPAGRWNDTAAEEDYTVGEVLGASPPPRQHRRQQGVCMQPLKHCHFLPAACAAAQQHRTPLLEHQRGRASAQQRRREPQRGARGAAARLFPAAPRPVQRL